jgi:hypothetical protein
MVENWKHFRGSLKQLFGINRPEPELVWIANIYELSPYRKENTTLHHYKD